MRWPLWTGESHPLTACSVPQEFIKDGFQFVNRCTKPDKVRHLVPVPLSHSHPC